MTAFCPCGSGQPYSNCCQRLHGADNQPLDCTPEALMRSRFTAFVMGNVEYLLATLHPSQQQDSDRAKITHASQRHQWRSLRVLACSPVRDQRATVEFVAFYSDAETAVGQLHECSRFVFEQQRWWYVDGDMLAPVKLGRNDVCWCGSGKKMKKCHP